MKGYNEKGDYLSERKTLSLNGFENIVANFAYTRNEHEKAFQWVKK